MGVLKLAWFFCELAADPSSTEGKARALEKDILRRGRKAVLDSRNASRQFHTTSNLQRTFRNIGFQIGNFFIQLSARKS